MALGSLSAAAKVGSKLTGLGSSILGIAKTAPVASAVAGGLGTGLLLADVMKPVTRRLTDPLGREVKRTMAQRSLDLADRMRARATQRSMKENEARLAALDPDLYSMLLAGRRLPIGGRVFGGRPDRDAVNAVTARMSTGGFTERTPEQEFLDLIS